LDEITNVNSNAIGDRTSCAAFNECHGFVKQPPTRRLHTMTHPTDLKELPAGQLGTTVSGTVQAPFIYFDDVAALGVQALSFQIEVAARTILPTADGGTRSEFVVTGHLRCSLSAAVALKEAIEKCLAMFTQATQGQQPAEPAPGLLN
jgi:hypothetical protein